MPIKPTDAKKLAEALNTGELSSLIEASDELMRIVMEAGDFDTAEKAALAAAEMSAAVVIRKEGGVRELARRVRDRVTEDDPHPSSPSPAGQQNDPRPPDSQPEGGNRE